MGGALRGVQEARVQAPHFRKSQLTIQSEAEGTVKTVWGSYAPPPDVPSRSAPPSVGPEHGQGEQQRQQRHLAVVVADRRRRDRQIIARIDSIHMIYLESAGGPRPREYKNTVYHPLRLRHDPLYSR